MSQSLRAWCRAHPLSACWLLVFGVAWLVWLPMVASSRGLIGIRIPSILLWLGGLGPIGAATLVEWAAGGGKGLRTLYGRLWMRGVAPRWYVAAAGLPVGFGLANVALRSLVPAKAVPLDALPLAAPTSR